jgi:hypothetical protein
MLVKCFTIYYRKWDEEEKEERAEGGGDDQTHAHRDVVQKIVQP